MENKCPLCGTVNPEGEGCRERFERCMGLEFESPAAFGAAHHLSVLCYMLQHNAYAREVWLEAREMLAEFVEQGVSPESMRQRKNARMAGGQRDWHVTRGPKLAEFSQIRWSRTIFELRLDCAENYCEDVWAWARAVLADTKSLMETLRAELG